MSLRILASISPSYIISPPIYETKSLKLLVCLTHHCLFPEYASSDNGTTAASNSSMFDAAVPLRGSEVLVVGGGGLGDAPVAAKCSKQNGSPPVPVAVAQPAVYADARGEDMEKFALSDSQFVIVFA